MTSPFELRQQVRTLEAEVARLREELEVRTRFATRTEAAESALHAAESALASARTLLETKRYDQGRDWNVRRVAWLRTNPAPGTGNVNLTRHLLDSLLQELSEKLPEGWSLDDGRNAATYASEHRDVHVELTHDELCVGTQESYRGSGDRTAAFIPLPVLLRLLEALEYKVIGPEDAAVLEACAKLDLRQHPAGPVTCYGGDRDVELAEWERRRAAKETQRG